MTFNPETDLDLDKLFLPAWAQQPASVHPVRVREDERAPAERPRQPARAPRRPKEPSAGAPAGRTREAPPPKTRKPQPRPGPAPRPPEPLPEVKLSIVPEEAGVESLVRQIKTTGRAYPLFEIAKLILQKPERYALQFDVRKDKDGRVLQPLFVCALDESLWLSEEEAVAHVLREHFDTFYQTERTPTDPPKGRYTFVAQCGLSGIILGPPNYHDYQNRLHRLHAERFAHMPFEAYKAKVKIIRDEAVVKQWIEEQSWKTEYICLNVPEPLRLPNRQAVEEHFRATHKDNIIKSVESHRLPGTAARQLQGGLARLFHRLLNEQRRFPILVASALSEQFSRRGLQFFKVNRITHVAVARPHYLDLENMPVSEGVRRIVEYIRAHPGCTLRDLIEALAPPPPIPVAPPDAQQPAPPPPSERTPEQTAVIADLHWLIHQGHVIEFANGILETAKKPAPKPARATPATPKAAPSPDDKSAPSGEAGTAALAAAEAAAEAAESDALVETSAPLAQAFSESSPAPEQSAEEPPAAAGASRTGAPPGDEQPASDQTDPASVPESGAETSLSPAQTAPR